jgi:1,2-diacylglycerol 3-alpha-glucosyltransferase
MKILLVINEFNAKTNGLSISTERFYNEFKRLGADVRVLGGHQYGEVDYSLEKKSIHPFEHIIEKQGYVFAKIDKKIIEEAVEWADIIHLEEPFFIQKATAKIAKKKGKIITGTFHLYPENIISTIHMGHCRFINHCMMLWFRHMAYKYCDFIQCPTHNVYDRLESCNYQAKKMVITNGITPERFITHKDKPEELKNKFIILSVGRFSVEKDQKTLLKALRHSKHESDILLIMAGQGPLGKKYLRMSKKLTNKPIMKFMKKEELMEITSYADVIVHCADVEVEGMSLMEGFAGGAVPIIAEARLSATAQYALTPNNKFKARRPKILANRIDYFFEHPSEIIDLRNKYQAWAEQLTVSKSAETMLNIWQDLLDKRK